MIEKKTLMIVDDETEIISSLQRALRCEQYDIISANSVEQACNIFDTTDVDLVIADYELGSGTGLDLFRYVQNHDSSIKCFLLTGHPDMAMSMSSFNNDLHFKIVLKPWNNERLKANIERSLGM